MAGFSRTILVSGLVLAFLVRPVAGFGGRLGWGYSAHYYPVAQVVYYPVYAPVYCPVAVAPVSAGTIYAIPRSAPPSGSQTGEPPLPSSPERGPKIIESRSLGGSYDTKDNDLCRVGFWNIAGRDVTVTINGKARTVPRNRSITVELSRRFVWQVEERDPHREQVPTGQTTYEIVIR
jgi:hypothetical protein